MVMDASLHDLRTLVAGSKYDQRVYPHLAASNGFMSQELMFLPPDDIISTNIDVPPVIPLASNSSPPRNVSVTTTGTAAAHSDDSEAFSDIVLGYINRMLMAEDIDEKFEHYPEHPALLAAEKPFLEILGEPLPPSPDQPPLCSANSVESPDRSVTNSATSGTVDSLSAAQTPVLEFPTAAFRQPPQLYGNFSSESAEVDGGNMGPYDPIEFYQLQTNPLSDFLSQSSFSSSNGGNVAVLEGLDSLLSSGVATDIGVPDFVVQSQPVLHFRRGLEEASRFLPDEGKLVIDLDTPRLLSNLPAEVKEERRIVEVKTEKDVDGALHRGRKHLYGDDLDAEEGRSNKQSAIDTDHLVREMMDKVLLCNGETCSKGVKELREALQQDVAKNSNGGHAKGSKGRGKKQPKKEVVDLETLLIHCAQAIATDDRRSATELLKQIRQHASSKGDGNQRLAQCFADGLEARLAGNGSQIYKSFTTRRYPSTDVLKAYQLYLAACPFKKISHFFSNQTILNAVEKAKTVHIIDYGIYYGFQWPCLIQRLSKRPGGPPKLRITGIDMPQPGFRPAERIEETGRYLIDYAETFNVPFEFQAIPARFEAVRIEDLHIEKDELLIVNCLYKFKTLMDESVVVESPRNMALNTIREMNPHVFIHGIVNGLYNAPFFVTRFREALFHYSAMFDMLDANIPRDNEERLLIESALFGREAINVISCEGLERMERPETYKQWQVRNQRAGFKQLPLNGSIMKRARDKVKCYHKDYVIDEDNRWLLQGWKGRIVYALSTWKPDRASSASS